MSDIKNELKNNYTLIPGWAVDELGLKGNDLIIFSIIHGFSQDGESRFHGGLKYLCKWTGSSKQGVIKNLQNLVSKGFIIKYENIVNNVKFCEYSVADIDELRSKFNSGKQSLPAISPELEEIDGGGKQSLTGGKQSLPNNINNNIINISTSKSNKLDLSVDTGSDEPSEVSYEQNEFNHNENSMGMSCYEEENKQTKTAHAGEDASDVSAGDSSMPETVDTAKEQSELDKLNAIKQFKGTPKPAKPKSTTSPFKKCLKMIYDSNYSDEVKSALVEFLKSLSQYRHITESAFELILNNLEKSIEECPYPNDEGLMNFLRLKVVKGSHAKGYRDFYKIKPYELTQWVSEFRGTSISVERKFNDDAKSVVYDPNNPDHQLATNPDGTPMIF